MSNTLSPSGEDAQALRNDSIDLFPGGRMLINDPGDHFNEEPASKASSRSRRSEQPGEFSEQPGSVTDKSNISYCGI